MAPVEVTEHALVARICPVCQGVKGPAGGGSGPAAPGGQSGKPDGDPAGGGTVAHKNHPMVPGAVHQLLLSVGAIVQAVHGVARQAETAVPRASPRQSRGAGRRNRLAPVNGYVWTFSTPSERYFLRRGRDKGVVDEVHSSFSGVLVSDFYAAYNHYPGLKQRWQGSAGYPYLKGLYPEDAASVGRGGSPGLHGGQGLGPSPSPARPSTQLMLEEKLMVLARPFLKDPLAVHQALPAQEVHQGTVCLRVGPSRALRNNAAERSLRHLVTSPSQGRATAR